MKRITAFANQKGGTGKTTSLYAVGAELRRRGERVLFVDMDAQANLSFTLQADPQAPAILDALTGRATAAEIIQETENGDIMPATIHLERIDTELNTAGREYRLKEVLEPVKKKYDYILIDCPRSLGLPTLNALTAAERVIIPAIADLYSLMGLGDLVDVIRTVQQYTNPGLKVSGILITNHDPRITVNADMRQIIEGAAHDLKTKVFDTSIRYAAAPIRTAQTERVDVISRFPKHGITEDYIAFIDELQKER
jgi:chromosome partitioning protein